MTEAVTSDPTKPLCTTPELSFLFYGPPGVGKSSLGASASRWLWRTRKLKTRLILNDAGSYEPYRAGVEAGYVECMNAGSWDKFPPNVLYKLLMEGWWPEDLKTPNSRLQPGFEELRLCDKCGKDSGSAGAAQVAVCKSCGVKFAAGQRLPVTRNLLSLQNVGLVILESMTMLGDTLLTAHTLSQPNRRHYTAGSIELQELAAKANEVIDRGQPSAEDLKLLQEVKVLVGQGLISQSAAPAQEHYLDADKELQMAIHSAKKLPVPYVIWTAHEGAWEEKINPKDRQSPSRLRLLGAAIPVMKRNKLLPGWVSVVGRVTKDSAKGTRELIMEEHIDGQSKPPGHLGDPIPWVGKINVNGVVPRLKLEDPVKVNNFEALMKAVEAARAKELP